MQHQQQSVVTDLYADFRNGHILLDLLEVLSGEVLVIPYFQNNELKNEWHSDKNVRKMHCLNQSVASATNQIKNVILHMSVSIAGFKLIGRY